MSITFVLLIILCKFITVVILCKLRTLELVETLKLLSVLPGLIFSWHVFLQRRRQS